MSDFAKLLKNSWMGHHKRLHFRIRIMITTQQKNSLLCKVSVNVGNEGFQSSLIILSKLVRLLEFLDQPLLALKSFERNQWNSLAFSHMINNFLTSIIFLVLFSKGLLPLKTFFGLIIGLRPKIYNTSLCGRTCRQADEISIFWRKGKTFKYNFSFCVDPNTLLK